MSDNQIPLDFTNSDDGQSTLELPPEKIEIALAQLSERYTALHNMRDRSMQFTIWILGLGLALGWLLLNEIALTLVQSLVILAFLVFILLASLFFLRGIRTGFENNMAIVRRLEDFLLLFEPGSYLDTKAILDSKFAGKKTDPPKSLYGKIKHSISCTEHFHTLNCLLISVFLLLIVLTFVNSCGRYDLQGSKQKNIEQIQGGNSNVVD